MNPIDHRALIAEWLPRVGRNAGGVGWYEFLTGGVSGSYTYHLRGTEGPCVLKLTQAGSPAHMLQRAQREVRFYRTLAGSLAVRVPRLLASAIDHKTGASVLLLAACEPPLGPFEWHAVEYENLARDLARLHAAYWDASERLAAWEWLRPRPIVSPAEVRAALAAWQTIWSQPHTAALFPAGRRERFENWLEHIQGQPRLASSLPVTLCHNDCHMGNLLRDPAGNLLWADWQEVGAGYGPEDLSFFCQRAQSAGVAPPLHAIVAAYCQQLSTLTGKPPPAAEVQRHMAAFELRTRLVHWPAYLAGAPPEQIKMHVERIEELAASVP